LEIDMARVVFIPKPVGLSYGGAMNRLRMWLDSRKIQTGLFRLPDDGRIGFEIHLATDDEAAVLGAFDWAQPPV
jgi:hypothetical protein